ncbi:hypothetical protein E7T06_15560 [Deinococcus sp. Arct2-2]|uniref:hypothetical protein n=1 Tax=Deinococcus sp. Arct2-2 TaxID=2568653 RepID=UPI0010A480DB|nr:hypothetical protein [Deinococcus sp. Arct2-2]THF68609.1 hypothetical protein E7T06_15560 [Deinococcus sp. Arct2-2]
MNPASPPTPRPVSPRRVPRERQMRRTQWVEIALTLLVLVGMAVLFRRPAWIPLFVALIMPLALGLMLWQYRTMDEFRRARYLKAWAASGIVGTFALTGLLTWGVFSDFGAVLNSGSAPDLKLSVWLLYIPWGLSLLTFYAVTAFLYRRDTGG